MFVVICNLSVSVFVVAVWILGVVAVFVFFYILGVAYVVVI